MGLIHHIKACNKLADVAAMTNVLCFQTPLILSTDYFGFEELNQGI